MADSVRAIYDLQLQIRQTTDLALDGITNPEVTRETTTKGTLNASSTVPATKPWWDDGTLSGATADLDLTALTRTNLPNVDMTGLKVQLFKFKAGSSNNSGGIVVSDHATNGYNIFGDSSGQVTALPGQEVMLIGNDSLADVSSSVKVILLTGTSGDTYSIEIVAG